MKFSSLCFIKTLLDYCSSLDCGPEAYDKIAEALGSKTPEEVKEYAAVFWKRGP